MTIKKKKLFKKRIVILFVLVACLLIFTLIVNPKNQEDKKLTSASKTFVQTDRQGKYDYVLMKTGDVNQMTMEPTRDVKLFLFTMHWSIWIKLRVGRSLIGLNLCLM